MEKNRNEHKKQWNEKGGGGVEKKLENGNGAATELLFKTKGVVLGDKKGGNVL